MADRTISVSLVAKVQGLVGGLATGKAALKDFGGELDNLQKTSKDKFSHVTGFATVAGIGLLGVAGAAVAVATTFDKQMSIVGSSANVAGKQLDQLRQAAIDAGRDTVFSATQAAQAETELAKAGVSTTDILNGGLKGALNLAAAGTLDLGDAATYTAQAMNIFGLSGQAVPHIADVLTAAANKSATDVKGIADALNQSGLVAKQSNLTLEQTSGVLALFAQNGLVGSDAGTSFKNMLQALNPTSQQTKALMDKLGISFYNTQGQFIGITGVAQVLHDKLGNLSDAQRNAALAQIFGSDAVRAASVLYQQGAKGVQSWIDKVNDTGAANRAAQANMDNLAGSIEQLKGSLETLAIKSSGGASAGLRFFADAATSTVNAVSDLPGPLGEAVTITSGLAGVSILAATGLVKARGSIKETTAALKEMGPLGSKASTALSGLTKWGGYAALGAGAIFTLYDVIHHFTQPAKADVDKLTDSVAQFGATGKATGELAKYFGGNLNDLGKDIAQATTATEKFNAAQAGMKQAAASGAIGTARYVGTQGQKTPADNAAIANVKALDQALAASVANGNTQAAAALYQQAAASALNLGASTAEVAALFPQYNKAVGDAALNSSALAKGFGSVTEQTSLMNGTLGDAIKQLGGLDKVMDALNGANETAAKAQSDYQAAVDSATATVDKYGKTVEKGTHTLDLGTAAGRANQAALFQIVDTSKAAAQAILDQTGSQEKANKAVAAGRAEFIKLATKILGSKAAAEKLADAYFKIPPTVQTKVSAPGLAQANDTATGYKATMDALDGKHVTTTVSTHYKAEGTIPPSQYFQGNRWGGAYTHAATGLLSDASIYSAANPGRYMIAEPQTGGEAFVPKFGDYARSMGILSTAASWYGATLIPGNRGGSSLGQQMGGSSHYTTNVYPQRADFTVRDLAQLQQVQELRQRVGRAV